MSNRKLAECCDNCSNFKKSSGEEFGGCELIKTNPENLWETCVSSYEVCDDFKPSKQL